MNLKLFVCPSLFFLALFPDTSLAELVVDFEDLATFTGDQITGGMVTGQFYNGNDGSGTTNSSGWSSRGVTFENSYTNFGAFDSWEGWAYSNVQDAVAPGFFNQYASFPGGGSDGVGGVNAGGNYAVAFLGGEVTAAGVPIDSTSLTLAQSARLNSVDLVLTTYAARYIRDGLDGFGTPDFDPLAPFGPGDFYRLTITGYDDVAGTGNQTNQIDVDLALDDTFLMDEWFVQDLSSLGMVRSVSFQVTSSQFSTFAFGSFLDNPAYFAIDNLRVVPEPGVGILILCGGGAVALRRRR